MNVGQLFKALTSRGVSPAIAKDVAQDFSEDMNAGTTNKPNAKDQWSNFNAGTVKNDDSLTQGLPRSADGASAPEQGELSSDEAPQHGVSEAHLALGESLSHAIGVAMKSEFEKTFSGVEEKLDTLLDILGHTSRKALEVVVRPPDFSGRSVAKAATPELANDLAVVTAALNRLRDAGQLTVSESIQASKLRNSLAICKATGEGLDTLKHEVAACASSTVRDVFAEILGLPKTSQPLGF